MKSKSKPKIYLKACVRKSNNTGGIIIVDVYGRTNKGSIIDERGRRHIKENILAIFDSRTPGVFKACHDINTNDLVHEIPLTPPGSIFSSIVCTNQDTSTGYLVIRHVNSSMVEILKNGKICYCHTSRLMPSDELIEWEPIAKKAS